MVSRRRERSLLRTIAWLHILFEFSTFLKQLVKNNRWTISTWCLYWKMSNRFYEVKIWHSIPFRSHQKWRAIVLWRKCLWMCMTEYNKPLFKSSYLYKIEIMTEKYQDKRQTTAQMLVDSLNLDPVCYWC